MLAIVLFILTASCGFTSASEECETPVLQYCEIHDYNFDAPTTKDGLVAFCENGKKVLNCIVPILKTCNASEVDVSKFLYIQSNVDAICEESNILYQVLYENVECIGSALASTYFGCPETVGKGMERVLEEKGIASEIAEQAACSASLFLLSCHVIHTHQLCGRVPGDAMLEIFKIFHLPIHCKREIAAELTTIVEKIELLTQEEMELESTFRMELPFEEEKAELKKTFSYFR